MNKWMTRIIICGLIGGSFGWFWCHEDGKTREKVSECPGGVSNAQETAFKNAIISWDRQNKLKKPIKIYRGAWNKKGYLEIIK